MSNLDKFVKACQDADTLGILKECCSIPQVYSCRCEDLHKIIAKNMVLTSVLESLSDAADDAQAISLQDIEEGDRDYMRRAEDMLNLLGRRVDLAYKVLGKHNHRPAPSKPEEAK